MADPDDSSLGDDRLAAEILRQTALRGPDRSICPSEVARALAETWRPLLGPVRRVAADLAEAGRIEVLHKGRPVGRAAMRGVLRLRMVTS